MKNVGKYKIETFPIDNHLKWRFCNDSNARTFNEAVFP